MEASGRAERSRCEKGNPLLQADEVVQEHHSATCFLRKLARERDLLGLLNRDTDRAPGRPTELEEPLFLDLVGISMKAYQQIAPTPAPLPKLGEQQTRTSHQGNLDAQLPANVVRIGIP